MTDLKKFDEAFKQWLFSSDPEAAQHAEILVTASLPSIITELERLRGFVEEFKQTDLEEIAVDDLPIEVGVEELVKWRDSLITKYGL